ncbi:DUF1382 family protein [Escherichia coli]|uniref:DUF1382 family protein n=1 Tax=Escherichia coli TaxID=562 RepID=UPI0020751EB4|nr:DUF1382 family protein [Escherichia coli]
MLFQEGVSVKLRLPQFVPIPVETDEEFHTLATSLSQKLEMMVAKAEADERDQV